MSRTPAVTPDQFTTFGGLLKYLRRRAGLTQRELSIAVGYSDAHIGRLESNECEPEAATRREYFMAAVLIEQKLAVVARLYELARQPARRLPF